MSLNDSMIFRWNTDEDGRPCSWFIPNEMQQVSTTHNTIQLIQVPDQLHRVRIVKEDGTELTEVFNIDEIKEDCFYVNYNIGLVQLHKSLQGQTVWSTYYGKGIVLISDARIFHSVEGSAVDTWDNILERSKDALDLVESAGGLANAMVEIEDKIERGHAAADRIQSLVDEVALYGYTVDLSRQTFAVKADETGEVKKSEIATVYCDVIAYKGSKRITPTLSIAGMEQCQIEITEQRIKLKTIETDCLQAKAIVEIVLEEGVSTQKEIVISKIFDGVSQYTVDMTNPFYSFEADSTGKIEKEQSVTCDVTVVKANLEYDNFAIKVQNKPNGLDCQINGKSVIFTASIGTALPDNGNCSVVITIDGVPYNKVFSWNKAKSGESAKSLIVTGNQILKYSNADYSGIPTPYQSVINATVQGLSGTPIWYYKEGDSWEVIQNQSQLQLVVSHSHPLIWGSKKETTIKCELDGYSDEISLVKLADGQSGSDSISVLLTNESHTVPVGNDGTISELEIRKVKTKVKAYKGTKEVACELSVLTSDRCVVGIEGQEVYLIELDSSPITATATINVNIDGVIIEKILTISKAMQGHNGNDGSVGSTYILNILGGTRSFTYSQVNSDPRPNISSTFTASLYKDGEEVGTSEISYYWVAKGHITGSSIIETFTPSISHTFDESIINNEVTLTATHEGNVIVQTVSIAITKDANGLDWVHEWDSTKVDIRDNVVLTPKLFAGSYDQDNDLITGVAIGQDMINNGYDIGIAGYQNNEVSFLLDTDGTLMVGNPFAEDSTGMYYDNGEFVLRASSLAIQGVQVPNINEVTGIVTDNMGVIIQEMETGFNDIQEQMTDLENLLESGLQDFVLSDVEKGRLQSQFDTLKIEYTSIVKQATNLLNNGSINGNAIKEQLTQALNSYEQSFNSLEASLQEILMAEGKVETALIEAFQQHLDKFAINSQLVKAVLQDTILAISKAEANKIMNEAREEILVEVEEVNSTITDLETTMNGSFKSGLISIATIRAIQQRISAIETELADVEGKYDSMLESDKLGTTSKTKLTMAKNELDLAFEQLKGAINSAIPDYLLTDVEIENINNKTAILNTKLKEYSVVAQDCNAEIALNSAQGIVDAITDEEVFNKVTSHGIKQGLFIEDGEVYINGQYIQTKNLKTINNTGDTTFHIDAEGNVLIKPKTFLLTTSTTTNVPTKSEVEESIANSIGYTVALDNDNQSIPVDSSNRPLEDKTYTVNIEAYKGATPVGFTIGNVNSANGITVKVNSKSVSFTTSKSTALTNKSGEFTIPVIIDNNTYNKKFTWSVSAQGVSVSAKTVTVVSDCQIFSSTDGISYSPSTITLEAMVQNVAFSKWQYKNTSGQFVDVVSGSNGLTVTGGKLTVSQSTSLLTKTNNTLTVKAVTSESDIYDVYTIAKLTNGQDGQDGVGVASIVEQYYLSTSMTTLTNGSWSTVVPTASRGKFIWTHSLITYTNGTTTTTNPICVSGSDGTNGTNGTDGVSITKVDVQYAKSSSSTTAPTTGWQTTSPTWENGKYIWSKTVTSYSNGTTTETKPACITGAKGDTGATGATGSAGKGIKSITEYYLASSASSGVTINTSGWQTNIQTTTTTNKYLWNYEIITYTDDSTSTVAPRIIGTHGATGATGATGKGIKSITNYYLATSSNSGVTINTSGWKTDMQTTTTTNKYLWNYEVITYTDNTTSTVSPRIIGTHGATGSTGATGASGADAYTILLSNENQSFITNSSRVTTSAQSYTTTIQVYKGAQTQSFTNNFATKTVNGITFTKTSNSVITMSIANGVTITADSGVVDIPIVVNGVTYNKTLSWSVAKAGTNGTNGTNGANAKSLDLVSTGNVIRSNDGGLTFTPSTLTLTAICQNVTVSKWQISSDGGATFVDLDNGSPTTLDVKLSSFTNRNTETLVVKCISSTSSIYDTITLHKLTDTTEIKVGGRNLVRNSCFSKGVDQWSPSSIATLDTTRQFGGHNSVKLSATNTTTDKWHGIKQTFNSELEWRTGEPYTISLWYYVEDASTFNDTFGFSLKYRQTGADSDYTIMSTTISPSNLKVGKWTRLTCTAKLTQSNIDYLYVFAWVKQSGTIWITDVQVENSGVATDWRPAPEDMEEYIDDSLQSMLNGNNGILDTIQRITSDDYISEAERADFKLTYQQIQSQYDTMCWTIDKMEAPHLNQNKTELTKKYNAVVTICESIFTNNSTVGANNVRAAVIEFFDEYNNALFAISTYTKDQLKDVILDIEALDGKFTVSSTKVNEAYDTSVKVGKHMKFDQNWLELYGTVNGSQSQFKTRLSNEGLEFFDGDDIVAYITNKKLNIENADIKQSLTVGTVSIVPSAKVNGGVVFKYNA